MDPLGLGREMLNFHHKIKWLIFLYYLLFIGQYNRYKLINQTWTGLKNTFMA